MSGNVEFVIEARLRDLGGFQVRRVLPAGRFQTVGPFIFFDHMGPVRLEPGKGVDVRPHPHIGLATVTYLFEGDLVHRDSLGFVQAIRPGDVNWMTAGRGIVHSERSSPEARAQGPRLHGIQSWVALPKSAEQTEPRFHHHPVDTLPLIETDGVRMRLIAGKAFAQESPVQTFSGTFYLDARVAAGKVLHLPAEHQQRGVYIAEGAILVAGERFEQGRMIVLRAGNEVPIGAASDARLMLLGGAPLDGPRAIWWNFVSSSQERIELAKADWAAGRFAQVPGETEHTPLP